MLRCLAFWCLKKKNGLFSYVVALGKKGERGKGGGGEKCNVELNRTPHRRKNIYTCIIWRELLGHSDLCCSETDSASFTPRGVERPTVKKMK